MKKNKDNNNVALRGTLLTDETDKIDVQKLLEQYDSESNVRKPVGFISVIISVIAISMSFPVLYWWIWLWLA